MNEIEVLYENPNLLALYKPSGLVVNKSRTAADFTLQDYVYNKWGIGDNPDIENPVESTFSARNGIVHRIDKGTSGIILVAKNEESFKYLQGQFKQRKVEKEYRAILIGQLPDSKIEINAPIARSPKHRLKFAIVDGGRESRTRIELEKELTLDNQMYSRVRVKPLTGRTHQIRVHCAALNTPVACDPIYNTKKQYESSSRHFSRLMLHAGLIQFYLPELGENITIEANLPSEFYV